MEIRWPTIAPVAHALWGKREAGASPKHAQRVGRVPFLRLKEPLHVQPAVPSPRRVPTPSLGVAVVAPVQVLAPDAGIATLVRSLGHAAALLCWTIGPALCALRAKREAGALPRHAPRVGRGLILLPQGPMSAFRAAP